MTATPAGPRPTDDVQSLLPEPHVRPLLPVWPDTARIFGLSRGGTFDAVARGDIPSIRVGGRIFVPTAALRRMVGIDPELQSDPSSATSLVAAHAGAQ